MKTNMRLLLLLFLLSFVKKGFAKTCHYSCQTCMYQYHQTCKTCTQGNTFLMVKNPSITPYPYRDSVVPTGLCLSDDEPSGSNVFGIILLISVIILVPLTKSCFVFYIVYTLQSVNLLSFIEISWFKSAKFILQSLQFLTPCNIMTASFKQQSLLFNQLSFYSLNRFFIQPHLQKSLVLLGIFNIIVFGLILNLEIVRRIKAVNFIDKCKSVVCCTDQRIQRAMNYLKSFYFMLIQETTLSVVIAFQFQDPVSLFTRTVTITYAIMTAIFLVYIQKFKISLFPNRFAQFFAVIKKLIFPIFVIIPFSYQFLLIALMAITCILEGFFDRQLNVYILKSRQTGFKVIQFLIFAICGGFFAADTYCVTSGLPIIVNYVFTAILCVGIGFLYFESVLRVRQRCEGKKVKVLHSKKLIPEISMNRDQNTRMMASVTKRQQTEDNIVSSKRQDEIDITSQAIEEYDDEILGGRKDTKDSYAKSKDQKQSIKQKYGWRREETIDKMDERHLQLRVQMRKRYGI